MHVLPVSAHVLTLDLAAAPSHQAGIAGVRKGGTVHFERIIQRLDIRWSMNVW